MKKYYFLFLIVISFLLGCSDSLLPTEVKIDSTINGKNITIITNQKFALELDLNADAGYQWNYSISDTEVVRIDSVSFKPKSGNWNQDGGVTVETFYFVGKRTGQCLIGLIEHRVWEKDAPPISTVQFSVIVKQ
jgi:predicted secreted protein